MLDQDQELRFCKARRAVIEGEFQNLNPEQRRERPLDRADPFAPAATCRRGEFFGNRSEKIFREPEAAALRASQEDRQQGQRLRGGRARLKNSAKYGFWDQKFRPRAGPTSTGVRLRTPEWGNYAGTSQKILYHRIHRQGL